MLRLIVMRIFDIEIYRDGGSIEFHIERDVHTRQIWLETPFKGEPRELRIGAVTVMRGNPEVGQLLADIEVWWRAFSPEIQQRVREVMARKGPFYNLDAATRHAVVLSRVLVVRDYVAQNYTA
jgi:hypothetical protein